MGRNTRVSVVVMLALAMVPAGGCHGNKTTLRGQDPAGFEQRKPVEPTAQTQDAPKAWYDDPRLAEVKPKFDEVKQERRRKVVRVVLIGAAIVGGVVAGVWLNNIANGGLNTDGTNPTPHYRR